MSKQPRTSTVHEASHTELERLHNRCKSGEPSAEQEKLARLIYNFGLQFAFTKFGFDRQRAKDFAQELYLAYAVHREDIVDIHKWLLQVSSNMYCEILRQRSRSARGKELSRDWYLDPDSPEQLIIDRLFARAGMRLFDRRDGQIVYMRIWRDMRFEDIAKELNLEAELRLTAGHVRMLYYRAIKKLSDALMPQAL